MSAVSKEMNTYEDMEELAKLFAYDRASKEAIKSVSPAMIEHIIDRWSSNGILHDGRIDVEGDVAFIRFKSGHLENEIIVNPKSIDSYKEFYPIHNNYNL